VAVVNCACCGNGPLLRGRRPAGTRRSTAHIGRELCGTCYGRNQERGTLEDWPRVTRSSAELAAAAERIRARGWHTSWPQVAAELGVTFAALDKARCRRRARVRAGSTARRQVRAGVSS
jgi:hypothetical protein